jgi:hypothetical protein
MSNEKFSFEEYISEHGKLVYTNVGDSMQPLLTEKRDLLIISRKPDGRFKKYDVALYKRDNGQYVLHRVLKVRENDYVICGDNRWKREYGITDKNMIGIMTAFVRNGKEISVTDHKYLLYVHIWCDFFYIRAFTLWCKSIPRRVKRKLRHLRKNKLGISKNE